MYTKMKRILVVIAVVSLLAPLLITGVVAQEQQDTQRINTITIDENGDATWNIEIRDELTSESEISGYQSYVDQVESSSNNQTTEDFRSDLSTVVSGANNSFDRNMELRSLEVNARVVETATGTFGVTDVSFTWTDYAVTDSDNNITVGQILSEGYTISEGERLRVVLPDGYRYDGDVTGGEVNGNEVEWVGPYAFSDVEINFEPSSDSGETIPVYVYGILLVMMLSVLVFLAYMYKFRDRDEEDDEESSDSGETTSDNLQTEEERLLSFIKENDGRVKQKSLSEEFDWSEAKVSRVTKKLEEEDLIRKLTIGRENVLDLEDDGN